LRSLRTECFDPQFILNERQLFTVLAECVQYFNRWFVGYFSKVLSTKMTVAPTRLHQGRDDAARLPSNSLQPAE
jgi:hypothetical protein